MPMKTRDVSYIEGHPNCSPGECGSCRNVSCGIYQGYESPTYVEKFEEYFESDEEIQENANRLKHQLELTDEIQRLLRNMSNEDIENVCRYIKKMFL